MFDVFSYLIPGFCYVLLIMWATGEIQPAQMPSATESLTLYSILIYSFICYMIGFISDAISSLFIVKIMDSIRGDLRKRVSEKFKGLMDEENSETYHFSWIYAFADVKAPQAREKADQFSAMSGLSRNLSLAFFTFAIVTIAVEIFGLHRVGVLALASETIGALVISSILMFRADTFRRWSHSHLLNVHKLLCEHDGGSRTGSPL